MNPYFRSIVTPAPRDAWQQAVMQDRQALIFQQPVWTDGLTSLREYEDASRMYETYDERLLILPMVRRRAVHPALAASASMPDGWGMGGIVSAQPVEYEDVENIFADIRGLPQLKTSLRPNPLTARVWSGMNGFGFTAVPRETHILDLDGGFDEVWSNRFPSSTRTKIRKAEKAGVEIEVGKGGQLLDTFYDLYLQWIDERSRDRKMPKRIARWLGKHREPLVKFQMAASVLGPAFQVWVAHLEGQPVAAAILLIGQHQSVYWRSASNKELAGPSRANDLLQRRMIETACTAGSRYYHMGESGGVASLKHFKSRFGAEPYAYVSYFRERLPLTRVRNLIGKLSKHIEQRLEGSARVSKGV